MRGFYYKEAVWVKDGPGCARLCAEWMVNGKTQMDIHSFDISRFYPEQKEKDLSNLDRMRMPKPFTHQQHPREPYLSQRELFVSPFFEREKELGGL